MKKLIFLLLFFSYNQISFAQTTYISVTAGGNWNNANTWDVDFDDTGGDGIPGPNDIAIVIGDGAGGGIVNITSNVEVGDLYVVTDIPNALSKGGALFTNFTLTINGQLGGILPDLSNFAPPTTTVIENDQRLFIVFTNANANVPNITNWGTVSALRNVTTTGNVQFEDVAILGGSTLNVSSGSLSINSGFSLVDASQTATLDVTGTLNINGSINGGSASTNFGTVTINNGGIVNIGTSAYLNSDNLNIASGATLNVRNNEANGWFHTTASGPVGGTFDANSTVSYSRNGNQGVFARTYGNLILSTSGVGGDKTLSSTGTLTVQGDFTVEASTNFITTANASNITLQGDLINNNGSLIFTRPVIFSGGVTHTLEGTVEFDGNVTIASSNTMDINGDVVFNAGLTDNNNNLTLGGDFTFNGTTYNQGSGALTFDAVGAQQIAGSGDINFRNLTVSGSTLSINATNASLSGLLSASGGSIDFDGSGAGSFTLISDASGTASVGSLATTTVSGNVNYQRFFDGAGNRWRNFGVGVTGATVTNITTSGFTINGNDLGQYNENEIAIGTVDDGWQLQSSFGSSIAGNRGYSMWTRAAQMERTVTFTGTLNRGNQVIPVSRTTGPVSAADDGWNLVNNPYASTIDWDLLTRSNLDAFAYVWDGSVYQTVGAGGDIPSGFISSGQAFWVHSSSGSPSLTVQENDKVTSSTTFLKESEDFSNRLVVQLTDELNQQDKTYVWFKPESTLNFDEQHDALKLSNGIFNLYSKAEDESKLAVNAAGDLNTCSQSVALGLDNIEEGTYQLSFNDILTFSTGYQIKLIDNYSDTNILLAEGSIYNFDVTADAASWGDNRFQLLFEVAGIDAGISPSVEINNSCEVQAVQLSLSDVQDGVNYSILNHEGVVISDVQNPVAGSVRLTIEKENLDTNQANILSVKAEMSSDCIAPVIFENIVNYDFESSPTISEVISATTCLGNKSPIVIGAQGAPENGYYRWYSSPNASEPVIGGEDGTLELENIESNLTYYVSAVNSQGCESPRVAVAVNLESIPAPIVTDGSYCSIGIIELRASGAQEGQSYRWYENSESTEPISGETSSIFNTPELSQSRAYYVSIITSNGCESERVEVTAEVNVNRPQSPDVTNLDVCLGQDVELTATGAQNNQFYRWYENATAANPIEGQNGAEFKLNNVVNSKTYFVSIANNQGCESERIAVSIEVTNLGTPEIQVNGLQLSINEGDIFQWYKDGQAIENATNNKYEVAASGTYSVEVTKGACSSFSTARTFVITGLDDVLYDLGLNIYPNPVTDRLNLTNYKSVNYTVSLYDSRGKRVLDNEDLVIDNGNSYFNTSNLLSGVYILNIELEDSKIVPVRILKQ